MMRPRRAPAFPPGIPEPGAVTFRPPRGERAVLRNGMVLHMLRDKTLPVVHITAFIRTGKIYDPAGKIGLGELTAALLKDGGTLSRSPEELDRTLEFLAASVESSMGFEEARVSMTCLSKDMDKVLDIFADVLMNPAFDPEKTKIRRDELLELVRRRNDNPGRAAVREALRAFYGPDHPYGWRAEEATVNAVSTEDMKAFHADYYRPDRVIIAAAGDFPSDAELLAGLEARFGGWRRGGSARPAIPPATTPGKRRVFHVQNDAPQAYIVMLLDGLKRHDPREYGLTVANEILGGGLSSRLAAEIRSRRGLAYTVYSYPARKPDCGYTLAYCGTRPETCAAALEEMLKQFGTMAAGPPPEEEVRRARDAIVNSFVFRFPTPFELVYERAAYEYYGYGDDYLDAYSGRIAAVSPGEVLDISRNFFRPENASIFVIGDSRKFEKPLSEFGPVTELAED